MVRLIARVIGVGVETADMLVHEILSRGLRDRRAVARYAGLTGSPDESGKRRREKGLARAGSARVRHGMIQLAGAFSSSRRTVRWPDGSRRARPTAARPRARR
ncbi:IS110 family transposase [Mesorhizobium sp. M00.F.Ca.ET.216.01.1.1]|uniref:IS110 family transposase n=1 Tax=Mesorhizobium sp. M00.F.Ca.ET.216.01.1.1 TaxID=2500528 RepID=UPI001FE0B24C|nr:IS110 family transposase [Mesorhizobium sp. M00.F.Ca.ET.216.01.1.1]